MSIVNILKKHFADGLCREVEHRIVWSMLPDEKFQLDILKFLTRNCMPFCYVT